MTGLVYSIFLGKRRGFGTHILSFKPHNVSYVIQGTIFLWGELSAWLIYEDVDEDVESTAADRAWSMLSFCPPALAVPDE